MARSNRFIVEIDFGELYGVADALSRIDAEHLGRVGVDAVNRVAERTEARARENIASGINITDTYLRARLGVRRAENTTRPEAVIYAPYRHTPLGRYDARQVTQPVKHPKRAKGDPARGIAKGSKPAGMSVEVVRGSRKTIRAPTFTIPRIKDSDGNPLLFQRTGGTTKSGQDRFRVLYGPSVYQLFRVQAEQLRDDVAADLQETIAAEAERAVQEILT